MQFHLFFKMHRQELFHPLPPKKFRRRRRRYLKIENRLVSSIHLRHHHLPNSSSSNIPRAHPRVRNVKRQAVAAEANRAEVNHVPARAVDDPNTDTECRPYPPVKRLPLPQIPHPQHCPRVKPHQEIIILPIIMLYRHHHYLLRPVHALSPPHPSLHTTIQHPQQQQVVVVLEDHPSKTSYNNPITKYLTLPDQVFVPTYPTHTIYYPWRAGHRHSHYRSTMDGACHWACTRLFVPRRGYV